MVEAAQRRYDAAWEAYVLNKSLETAMVLDYARRDLRGARRRERLESPSRLDDKEAET